MFALSLLVLVSQVRPKDTENEKAGFTNKTRGPDLAVDCQVVMASTTDFKPHFRTCSTDHRQQVVADPLLNALVGCQW
eukprot:s721_g4.t1